MLFFSLALTLVLLSHYSCGLIIHMYDTSIPSENQLFNITTIDLKSTFSTISTFPASAISSSLFILSHNAIDNCECTCKDDVLGKVVIFGEGTLPSLWGCNRAHIGRALALGRILEKQGAIGVVIPAEEEV
jgi:hypothetical protein